MVLVVRSFLDVGLEIACLLYAFYSRFISSIKALPTSALRMRGAADLFIIIIIYDYPLLKYTLVVV